MTIPINLKTVVLGDASVGKTSLITRFAKQRFSESQQSTVGAAFTSSVIKLESCSVKLEIWDTAGQEKYASLAPMYYRGSPSCLILFDVTSQTTFTRAKTWVDEVRGNNSVNCFVILVGNKIDLSERQVTFDEAVQFAQSQKIQYMECSAKTGQNVEEIFTTLAKIAPGLQKEDVSLQPQRVNKAVVKPVSDSQGKGCC